MAFEELGVVNVREGDSAGYSSFHAVDGFDLVNLSAGTHTIEVKFKCFTAGTCYYFGSMAGDGGDWEHLNVLVFSQP
jgi:hypothetical protein